MKLSRKKVTFYVATPVLIGLNAAIAASPEEAEAERGIWVCAHTYPSGGFCMEYFEHGCFNDPVCTEE